MKALNRVAARAATAVLFVATWACTTPAPQPSMLHDARTPLQRLADSTQRLVGSAAQASDSAVVWAGLAMTDTALQNMRARLLTTREAVERVSSRLAQAAQQGEKVRVGVIAETRGSRQADDYERYWLMGREKLTLARAYAVEAAASADSALSCPNATCTASRTRLLQTQVNAASGTTRDAESLVRVALRFVY